MAKKKAGSLGGVFVRVVLVVGGLLLLAAAWLFSKMPRPSAPRVEAAVEAVGINDGVSFAWILRTAQGAVLVDAGFDAEGKALREELRREGLKPEDVHAVLLTHGHPDHWGAAHLFSKARLYAGPGEPAKIHGERPFTSPSARIMPLLFREMPPPPGEISEVQDGQELELDGEKIRVYHLPGHTSGSVAYLWREILFSGDALMREGEGVSPSPSFFSEDAAQARTSLEKLRAAPFTQLADGHTGVTADARQKLERLLQK